MLKYYTRACNFYYGKTSLEMVKKKLAFPLHGNRELSFDTIEILSKLILADAWLISLTDEFIIIY